MSLLGKGPNPAGLLRRRHVCPYSVRPSASYLPSKNEIMALRQRTSLPISQCRQALATSSGNVSEAIEWLRSQSLQKYGALQIDNQGAPSAGPSIGQASLMISPDRRRAVVSKILSKTDFASSSFEFKEYCAAISDHLLKASLPFGADRFYGDISEDVQRAHVLSDHVKNVTLDVVSKLGEPLSLDSVYHFRCKDPNGFFFGYAHPPVAFSGKNTGDMKFSLGKIVSLVELTTDGPSPHLGEDVLDAAKKICQQLATNEIPGDDQNKDMPLQSFESLPCIFDSSASVGEYLTHKSPSTKIVSAFRLKLNSPKDSQTPYTVLS